MTYLRLYLQYMLYHLVPILIRTPPWSLHFAQISHAYFIMAVILGLVVAGLFSVNIIAVRAAWIPSPAYSYSSFKYGPIPPKRYATALQSPLSISTPYALPFTKASTLLDTSLTYTTYSLTATDDGPFG
jgi:hypothetical protein